MPTFRSIGMNPNLSTRLVTESIVASTTNDDCQRLPLDQQYQLIDTPQALLSRDPTSLILLNRPYHTIVRNQNNENTFDEHNNSSSTTRSTEEYPSLKANPVSHSQAQKLRQDVALALIQESRSGKRIKEIRDVIQTDIHTTKRLRETDDLSNAAIDDDSLNQQNQPFAIHGTVSVLDLLKFDGMTMNSAHLTNKEEAGDNCLILPTLSTGCHQLDDLIALPNEHVFVTTSMEMNVMHNHTLGGIPFRYVTQFSGAPSTGKTQLALQLACSPGLYQTWYLSSDAAIEMSATRLSELASYYRQNFSSQRSSSMLSDYDYKNQHCVPNNWRNTVLQRTFFSAVSDEYQVLSKLAELESFLDHENQGDGKQVDCDRHWKPILLVLDSCSGCLSSSDDSLLLSVASTIKRLTRTYGLATVLVNGTVANRSSNQQMQVTGEQQGNFHQGNLLQHTNSNDMYDDELQQQKYQPALKPALGRSWWKMAADIHIWIDSLSNGMLRATLERHPSKTVVAEGVDNTNRNNKQVATFRITSQGIQGVSN